VSTLAVAAPPRRRGHAPRRVSGAAYGVRLSRLGVDLRAARKEMGLSLVDFAAYAHVSLSTARRAERGERVHHSTAALIREAVGTPAERRQFRLQRAHARAAQLQARTRTNLATAAARVARSRLLMGTDS
jgi:transcriptional regulator with XRE-family HTH domain